MVGLGEHVSKYPHQNSSGRSTTTRGPGEGAGDRTAGPALGRTAVRIGCEGRTELRDQIREAQQRLAITTVFVTHDQEEALSMADRVCVMAAATPSRSPPRQNCIRGPPRLSSPNCPSMSSRVNVELPGTRAPLRHRRKDTWRRFSTCRNRLRGDGRRTVPFRGRERGARRTRNGCRRRTEVFGVRPRDWRSVSVAKPSRSTS